MKTLYLLLFVLITISSFGQSTESLSYQAVIRDSNELLVVNETVGVQVSILQGTATGSPVYIETQTPTTNINGLATFNIGEGIVVSGDFSAIDWSSSAYFIKTETDPEGGANYTIENTNQIASAARAFYSDRAELANTADYNTLTNLPTTITQGQSDKIDLISVTSPVNLDQLSVNVDANNAKVSFPGFGTVPGTALEGNNTIWQKSNSDIFYTEGKVAIGVDETANLGNSELFVNGGISLNGIPAQTESGMLYYDNSDGDGKFHYIDNTGADIAIPDGTVTYTGGVWTVENGDVTTQNDVSISGSMGIGIDISTNEVYGFNTLILKENNLRILFDDSDDPMGSVPSNDWQFEFNESMNGGTSHFAIIDQTNSTTPFKILAGAPDNSLYISTTGDVGIGTNSPTSKLDVNGNVKAASFIGDGSGLTGITGGTGGISNNDDTLIAADTNMDNIGEIVFQTQNQTRMTITNNGNVGIGTATPSNTLEVIGDISANGNVDVAGNLITNSITFGIANENDISTALEINVAEKSHIVIANNDNQNIQGFSNGLTGQKVSLLNTGTGTKTIVNAGTGAQSFLLPQSVDILLGPSSSATFVFSGTNWYCVGLSN